MCRATTCSTTTHICVQQAKKMMIGDEAEPILEFPTRNQESINQRTFAERLLGLRTKVLFRKAASGLTFSGSLLIENIGPRKPSRVACRAIAILIECKFPVEGTISSFFDIFNDN